MDISTECLDDNISHLIKNAMECKNFIRIDMENSNTVDTTINLYKNIKKQYEQIGIVFQAYLYRTENDLYSFKNQQGFNFRLCKGIYKESSELAIQNHEEINNNFLKLLQFAFDNNIYVGIATHDLPLIKKIYQMINEYEISKDNFEFQVLYGVPMSGWLEKHLEHGYKVRIYVPFGENWYEYSLRRLKENPDIAGYIIKDLFRT
jgi:proline dehydrogenase